jgi:hypothetical protein
LPVIGNGSGSIESFSIIFSAAPFPNGKIMKTKILVALAFVSLLAGKSMAAYTDIVGQVTQVEINSSDPVDQSACEVGMGFVLVNSAWYWFPGGGDEGKTMLALFMTAKTSGQQVFLRVTDQRNICPNNYKKITIAQLEP